MPLIAALFLTELILEANKTKSTLYVALMDAKKAFDILWHGDTKQSRLESISVY
jgi:hypothetical protein